MKTATEHQPGPRHLTSLIVGLFGIRPLDWVSLIYFCAALAFTFYMNLFALNMLRHGLNATEVRLAGQPDPKGIFAVVVCMVTVYFTAATFVACPSYRPLEFEFTRAIHRATLFRARILAIAVVIFLPPLLALAFSAIHPDIVLDVRDVDVSRFEASFPGSFIQTGDATNLVVKNGLAFLCGFQFWWITLTFFFVVGFSHLFLESDHLRPEKPFARAVSWAVGIVILFWTGHRWFQTRIYDNCLLFFREHWIWMVLGLLAFAFAVHRFCEKRFNEMEVL